MLTRGGLVASIAHDELSYAFPEILPGGGVLFTIITGTGVENPRVAALDLNTGEQMVLLSGGGSLVYETGGTLGAQNRLVWVDRQGREEPLAADPLDYSRPDVSPDGGRVAVGSGAVIWIYDVILDTPTRLTADYATMPRWSPDGRRVSFSSNRAGASSTFSGRLPTGRAPSSGSRRAPACSSPPRGRVPAGGYCSTNPTVGLAISG